MYQHTEEIFADRSLTMAVAQLPEPITATSESFALLLNGYFGPNINKSHRI
jgi:hypothetical protein